MSSPSFSPTQFAFTAFAFLARDERRLFGLLDLAGLTPDAAKTALMSEDPGLMLHVAEYLMSDEGWARAYCEEHGLTPDQLAQLAMALGHNPLMQ